MPSTTRSRNDAGAARIRVWTPLGVRWVVAFVLFSVLLGALAASSLRNNVENNLQTRVEMQLTGKGLGTVSPAVDGRNVTLTVPAGVSPERAKQVTRQVEGVGTVEVAR